MNFYVFEVVFVLFMQCLFNVTKESRVLAIILIKVVLYEVLKDEIYFIDL